MDNMNFDIPDFEMPDFDFGGIDVDIDLSQFNHLLRAVLVCKMWIL